MQEVPAPSGRTEKRVLLVSVVILVLAFFSTSFTGYYNVGKSGRGVIDCITVERAKAFVNSGEHYKMLNYDFTNDGKLDYDDIELLEEEAMKRPCTLPPECAEEGQTRCAENNKVINLCIRDALGRLVIEEVPCEEGYRCEQRGDRASYGSYREASCVIPFRRAQP